MKLGEFYRQIVRAGIARDPRKGQRIQKFEDSGLLYGDPKRTVSKVMVGIDIESAELMLAARIREQEGLDLAMAHHPEGSALAGLHEVMRLQTDLFVKLGMDQATASELMQERIREVERGVSPANHMRAVDTARLLDMPFVCSHTPADNQVAHFLSQLFAARKPRTVEEIVDLLLGLKEYQLAAKNGTPPKIISGRPSRHPGRIFVEMTGGTEGPRDVYDKLYKAGVRTLVSMHLAEDHFKKVKDANLNVVIAGHISSDTLGMNLLLDCVERSCGETFEVVECSGFNRVKRK